MVVWRAVVAAVSYLGVVVDALLLEVLCLQLLELGAQRAQLLNLRRQPVLARLDLRVDLLDHLRDVPERLALDLVLLTYLLLALTTRSRARL